MAAIQRASRLVRVDGVNVIPQTESPLIVPHSSFVGLSLSLSNGAAVVVVAVDVISDGDFDTVVEMAGTGTFRHPVPCAVSILGSAAYVKITWNTGTLQVFQKG